LGDEAAAVAPVLLEGEDKVLEVHGGGKIAFFWGGLQRFGPASAGICGVYGEIE
jgi:hypothetical protein